MDALFEWGYLVIQGLQSYRNPFFDLLFQLLTLTGDVEFYLILLPTVYWMVNKRLGTHFAVLFVFSTYINLYLKALLNQPRPSASRVAVWHESSSGGGLPSGHTQNATVLWGFLAKRWPQRWFQALMVFLIVGAGISRIYFGVHFPHDVLAGWALGLMVLAVYFKLASPIEQWLGKQALPVQIILPTTLTVLLLLFFNDENITNLMAAFFGLALGVPLEVAYVQYQEQSGNWIKRLGRYLLGVVILILIWRGLKPFLPDDFLGNFIRYGLIGFWIALGAPWLFVKSKLAEGGDG